MFLASSPDVISYFGPAILKLMLGTLCGLVALILLAGSWQPAFAPPNTIASWLTIAAALAAAVYCFCTVFR